MNEQQKISSGDRMTDAEFADARERYELGTSTLVDLAEEYGVSRQALSKRFKNNGVVKGSRAHEVAEATKKGVKGAVAATDRFSDKRSEWIEETRVTGIQALKQARLIGQKTVIDAVRAGNPLETVEADIRAVTRYSKMLVENIEASLRILRSEEHVDENDLPRLVIEDLTNQEVLDHHKMSGALDEDATLEELVGEVEIGDL